jgi:hypothetical protein
MMTPKQIANHQNRLRLGSRNRMRRGAHVRADRRLQLEALESRLLLAFTNVSAQYVGPYLTRVGYDLQPAIIEDSGAPTAQQYKTFWLGEYNPADADIPRLDPQGQPIALPGDRIYAAFSATPPNGPNSQLSAPQVVYKPQGGATGAFATDDHLVGAPSVLKVGGVYYMFIETYGNWLTRINRLYSFSRGDTWTTNGTADLSGNLVDADASYAVEGSINFGFAPRYRRDGTHAVYSGQLVAPDGKRNRFLSTNQIVEHTDGSGVWSQLNSGEPIFWLFSNPGTGRKPLYSFFDGANRNTYITDDPNGGGIPGATPDYGAGPNGMIGYAITDLTSAPDSLGALQNRIRMLTSTDGVHWTAVQGLQTDGALIAPLNERTAVYPHACENPVERYDPHRDYGSGYPVALERDGYLELYFSDDTESFAGKPACGIGPQLWRIRIPLTSIGDAAAYVNAPRQRTHIAEAAQGPGTGYSLSDIKWSPRLQRYFAFNIGPDGNPEVRYSEVRPDPSAPPEFPAANRIAVAIPANLWTGWGGILGDELGHTIDAADHTALSLVHEVLPRGLTDNHSRDFAQSLVLIFDDLPRAPVGNNFIGDRGSELVTYRQSDGRWLERDALTGATANMNWGGPNQTAIAGIDYDGDKIADYATYHAGSGFWTIRQSSNGEGKVISRGGYDQVAVGGIDYDGDGRTDLVSYRPDGLWSIRTTANGDITTIQFGATGQMPVGGIDFDGDGRTDLATYRMSDGHWFIRYSATGQLFDVGWGGADNVPVGGIDFDGDKKTDLAAYRVTDGVWSIRLTSNGQGIPIQWGAADQIPVGGMDVDGDGRGDLVTFRPSDRVWSVRYTSLRPPTGVQFGEPGETPPVNSSQLTAIFQPVDQLGVARTTANVAWYLGTDRDTTHEIDVNFGNAGAKPVVGNWLGTGDFPGAVDAAFNWWLDTDGDAGAEITFQFGATGDIPVVGDWNGDGVDDAGVFRGNTFYLDYGARGFQASDPVIQFGILDDLPIVGDWNGDGTDDLGVFRPGAGRVILDTGPRGFNGESGFQYGLAGDVPLAGDVNGDGRDDVVMTRAVTPDGLRHWYVALTSNEPNAHGPLHDDEFAFGFAGDTPVFGNWKLPEITLDNGAFWSGWALPLDVGTFPYGASAMRTFTITNEGTVPLNLGAISLPEYFSLAEPIASTLAAGASTPLKVRLNTARPGVWGGSVTIPNSDGNESPFTFDIRGAVQPPLLGGTFSILPSPTAGPISNNGFYTTSVSPHNAAPVEIPFWITNRTTASIPIAGATASGELQISQSPPQASVAAMEWSGFKVLLTNTNPGVHQGRVRLQYGNGLSYEFDLEVVVLAGTPTIGVDSEGPISSGQSSAISIGESNAYGTATRTFTITNTGEGLLQLGEPTVAPEQFALSYDDRDLSLSTGQTFTFRVRLAAQAIGAYSAAVTIPSNDPNTPTFTFPVAGTAAAGAPAPDSRFHGRAYLALGAAVTLPGASGPINVRANDIIELNAQSSSPTYTVPFDLPALGLDSPAEIPDALSWVTYIGSDEFAFTISIAGFGDVPGLGPVHPADLIRYSRKGNVSTWTKFFDASQYPFLATANIDAHELRREGDQFFSFTGAVDVPGVGLVGGEDVVELKDGVWSLFLDGSAAGLEAPGEAINAFALQSDNEFYLTTAAHHDAFGNVGGAADVANVEVYSPNTTVWLGTPLQAADLGLAGLVIQALDFGTLVAQRSELAWQSYGDITQDGRLTVTDINQFSQAINNGTTSPLFDLTTDFRSDASDLEALLSRGFGTVIGDVNLDRRVDRGDAAVVARSFGGLNSYDWSQGDVNGDSKVDLRDLAAIGRSQGYGGNASSADALVVRRSAKKTSAIAEPAPRRLVAERRSVKRRASPAMDSAAVDQAFAESTDVLRAAATRTSRRTAK